MKKIVSIVLVLCMMAGACIMFASCEKKADFTVGVCQLVEHPMLSEATKGFEETLKAEMEQAGKTVEIEVVKANGESSMCTTVVGTFIAKNVDMIIANATPALLAAANSTTTIPVLGTSVTDYNDTFKGNIPANVSGTSDAVSFGDQAQMMIETLKLVSGDKVGVIYCSNESNSKVQYDAVKKYFDEKGIVTTAYTFAETTELSAVSTKAADESKAIFIPSDNTVTENQGIVSTICNEKNVPIFTSYGGDICYASLAIDYYQLGAETAKMAAQVLLGEKKVSDLEIKTITPSKSYNKELCEKLGIAIPEDNK